MNEILFEKGVEVLAKNVKTLTDYQNVIHQNTCKYIIELSNFFLLPGSIDCPNPDDSNYHFLPGPTDCPNPDDSQKDRENLILGRDKIG